MEVINTGMTKNSPWPPLPTELGKKSTERLSVDMSELNEALSRLNVKSIENLRQRKNLRVPASEIELAIYWDRRAFPPKINNLTHENSQNSQNNQNIKLNSSSTNATPHEKSTIGIQTEVNCYEKESQTTNLRKSSCPSCTINKDSSKNSNIQNDKEAHYLIRSKSSSGSKKLRFNQNESNQLTERELRIKERTKYELERKKSGKKCIHPSIKSKEKKTEYKSNYRNPGLIKEAEMRILKQKILTRCFKKESIF